MRTNKPISNIGRRCLAKTGQTFQKNAPEGAKICSKFSLKKYTLSDGFCPAIESPSSLFPRKFGQNPSQGYNNLYFLIFLQSKTKSKWNVLHYTNKFNANMIKCQNSVLNWLILRNIAYIVLITFCVFSSETFEKMFSVKNKITFFK